MAHSNSDHQNDNTLLLPSLSVTIGTKEKEEDEWKWAYLERTDGLILTGSAKFAQVKVFYGTTTTLRYAAGYWSKGESDVGCSAIYLSGYVDKFTVPAKSRTCFLSSSLLKHVDLTKNGDEPQEATEITIRTFEDGQQKDEKWPAGVGAYKAVAIVSTSESETPSTIKIAPVEKESDAKRWGEITVKEGEGPVLALAKGGEVKFSEGTCTGAEKCGENAFDKEDPPAGGDPDSGSNPNPEGTDPADSPEKPKNNRTVTIVIVVAVVVVVLAIIIAVVVVLVFRKRQVSNCDESSLSSSSQDHKKMGQKDRPRHNSRMPRKPSHAQKESYGPLEA